MLAVPEVIPRPLPCEFTLADFRREDGTKGIVLQLASPLGVHFYFFSADAATALASEIRERVTGIVVASNGQLGPHPEGS